MASRAANWEIIRPITRIGKLNKYLEIPAFTEPCGLTRASLFIPNSDTGIFETLTGTPSFASYTLECWAYLNGAQGYENGGLIWAYNSDILANYLAIRCDTDGFRIDSGGLWQPSIIPPIYEWVHLAISRQASGADAILKFYINGELRASTTALGTDNTAGTNWIWYLGSFGATDFKGYIGDARFWNSIRTPDEIKFAYKKYIGNGYADLLEHQRCIDTISASQMQGVGQYAGIMEKDELLSSISTDQYPPIDYGVSFFPLKFVVVADKKHSLKYPIVLPEAANFGLTISWLDSSSRLHRRLLAVPTDRVIDMAPYPAKYSGEKLPLTYNIEVWNLEGESTVTLSEAVQINTSIKTDPTSSIDTTQQVAATPTKVTAIWEPFPLTGFPLFFDNEQNNW